MKKALPLKLAIFASAISFGAPAFGADLPKATQQALAKLRLDPSILKSVDQELNVPKAWIDGAKKEGEVVILGTWLNPQFPAMVASFRERYPYVKLNHHQATTAARGMRVLIALREGRVIADVTTSIADSFLLFEKAKALADLRELPAFKSIPSDMAAPEGNWVAHKVSYRCMAYNTKKVKASDLPKRWDDLLTNPHWRGQKIALSNHPNAWLLNLWTGLGEKWGHDFTKRLFEVVNPQQRKEGMPANLALTVAGEFDANIPAPEWLVQRYADKGAPVSYHCPEPVPITLSQIVMLKDAPNKNGARLFVNWLLSSEGQFMQYATTGIIPAHKSLQMPVFVPFYSTISGKRQIVRDDAMLDSDLHKKMVATWQSYWTKPVGEAPKKTKKKKQQ